MTTIKFSNEAKCPKCKTGLIMYDGAMTQKLPLGLGFAPGGFKFQVDFAISKGFAGECMECSEKIFAVKSTRHAVKYPSKINRQLSAMAA